MFFLFGILKPATGKPASSEEAPFKKSFFGTPPDAAVVPIQAEEDALYLAGKRLHPPERPPQK